MRPAGVIGVVDVRPALVCALTELVGSGRSITGPGWGPFAAAGAAMAMDSADNPMAVAVTRRVMERRSSVPVWWVVFMPPPF